MGAVFGKYKEPAFDVVLSRMKAATSEGGATFTPYEIRRYSERFAVEARYIGGGSPFPLLAGYIGVLQTPQNEKKKSVAMTTPVSMLGEGAGGTKIAMTTPVSMHGEGGAPVTRKMQFMLPAEFDDISKIPNPTNPNVKITKLPQSLGAVHRYSGALSRAQSKEAASALVAQLTEDGVEIDKDDAMNRFQYWRFNPPMYPPWLSRNEIWIELTQEDVDVLKQTFSAPPANMIPTN